MYSVYIASPFNRREKAKELRAALVPHGITCTSRWLDSHTKTEEDCSEKVLGQEAEDDLGDIAEADAFVLLADQGPSTSGGYHVELGFALGAPHEPLVIVVGTPPKRNLFHYVDGVRRVQTVEQAITLLNAHYKARRMRRCSNG